MIAIEKLRYVRLGVEDLSKAVDFASRIVGLQAIPAPEGTAYFRSDWRDHTLVLYPSDRPEQTLAVELRSEQDLRSAADQLGKAGYNVSIGDAGVCNARRVNSLVSFRVRDGVTIELVVRPQHSGWRYFGTRDAGITEFFGVAFASTDVDADIRLWTTLFNGHVTDYVGDAAYISIDDEHHRIAVHPSTSDRLLEIQFRVEGMHELMQNSYFMQSAQVPITHGPGRRPTSQQVFLSFKTPYHLMFGLVAEGDKVPQSDDRLPRQFPRAPSSFCAWGSLSEIPEYSGTPGLNRKEEQPS